MKPLALATLALLALAAEASAFPSAYTEYTDEAAWDAAFDTGELTSLSFVGFSSGAVMTTQYTTTGATFLGSTSTALVNGAFADGSGLSLGAGGTVVFGAPTCAIGADYADGLQFVLRDAAGAVITTSAMFGGAGTGLFAGVISRVPATSVDILDWSDTSANLDNLWFGPCPADSDGDGVLDADDDCAAAPDGAQADLDGDGLGDACDPPSCGNGFVEAPETCDGDGAGAGGETADCDLDCTASACGDAVVNGAAGEQCEAGDGCTDACRVDLGEPDTCDETPDGGGCSAAGGDASVPGLALLALVLLRRGERRRSANRRA